MIPWLRRPLSLGLALDHVGKRDEARPILEQERERLLAIRDEGGELAPILARLDQVLGES